MWCHVAGQGAPDICKVWSAFFGSSSLRWKPMQDKKFVLHRWIVDGWLVWQANRQRYWDRFCSAGMERRSKCWRKANKHRTLKEACQPPNTCINRTYTIHILSYMTVPPWLLDPEMKAIHSFQMSQIFFHQHGIYYIAEDQILLYVHLITFLLQHLQTHPLEDSQSIASITMLHEEYGEVIKDKFAVLLWNVHDKNKLLQKLHWPLASFWMHNSLLFYYFKILSPQLITSWKQHSKSNILWSLTYTLP